MAYPIAEPALVRALALKVGVAGSILPRTNLSEDEVNVAQDAPEVFELDSSYITLKPKIGYCKFYAKNSGDGCTRADCPRLHICPFYVANSCTSPGGCRKSHSFTSEQNARVLSVFKIDGLPDQLLMKIVRESPEFRLLPEVCTWYNSAGCRHGSKCKFLHICKFHVAGICRYARCRKNHRLTDIQCLNVLRNNGVEFTDSEERTLLGALYQKMAGKGLVDLDKMTNSAGDERDLTPCVLTIAEVCGFHQQGKCTATNPGKPHCVRLHSSHTYHWQLSSNTFWYNLPLAVSENLEKKFVNPKNTLTDIDVNGTGQFTTGISSLLLPGKWTVNFEKMTLTAVRGGAFYDIRRLATLNWATVDFQSPFTSKYCWYYSDDNGKTWHETHQIAEIYKAEYIEMAYQRGESSFHNANFDTMTISAIVGPRLPLRRRPCLTLDYLDMQPRSCPAPFPDEWSDMGTSEWLKRVALDQSSEEFAELKGSFARGWNIQGIERIQNPHLFQQFVARQKATKVTNDLRLFVVADSKYISAICQENFHPIMDKSPKFGGASTGVRFSATPLLAHELAIETQDTQDFNSQTTGLVMFSARVLVGDRIVAPRGPECSPYSIVLDVRNPKAYIKQKMVDIYPEFVIRYSPSFTPGR